MTTNPRPDPNAQRPPPHAPAAPLLLALLLLAGCAAQPPKPKTRRGNLAEGALLLTMYAHEHQGRYPDDLRPLGNINPFYAELLTDPATGEPFIYVGKEMTIRDSHRPLLIASDPDNLEGTAVTVEGNLIRVKLADVLPPK